MGKQLKKIAKYSMAAALASSALVPSAVALAADEKEVATDISFVVVKNEQGLIKLDLEAYNAALAFDEIKDTDVQYVVADNGDIFTLDAYNAELAFADSPAEALKTLTENNAAKDIVVKDGKISEDGKAVAEDETPEEKVNETFFYNLAA